MEYVLRSAVAMDDAPPDELERALEAQQELAESSLEAIFDAYDEAIEEGTSQPVVLLIDCEDELGSRISRAWLGDDAVDEAIALQAEQAAGQPIPTTVFVSAIAYEDCRNEVAKAFPYLAEALAEPPSGDGVLIISVTSGGASALTAPLTARP